jgi:DNA-binding beta-propeller fold protein YncE
VWELPIGKNPSEILVTRDGKRAFVSIRDEDKVRVVDLTRKKPVIIGETGVGAQPDTLSLTRDEKTLVIGLRGIPQAQMALVNTDTLAVRLVSLPGGTTGHHALSPDGRYTYIAVNFPGSVAVVDNRAGSVVDVYPYPGGPLPHGVFYVPAATARL